MAKLVYDFSNLLGDNLGNKKALSRQEICENSYIASEILANVFVNSTPEHKAVFDILDEVNLAKIKQLAGDVRNECEDFVVLGIGGSSLGSCAIFNALKNIGYNYQPREIRGAPRFFVEDSVDPESVAGLLAMIDLEKTIFCVVSKSGKTTETLTQFLYMRDLCETKFGENWVKHFVILTDDNENFLHNYAKANGLRTLLIPTKLGGRYSVLSAVGMFPSAVLGLDVEAIISGAKSMLEIGKRQNIWENAPLLSALCNFFNYKKGSNITVMIPYSESLSVFDDWFCQLWGESIGRNVTADGRALTGDERIGQTPIQVTGPSVQHSQFQLYLEGPDDKTFTFVGIKNFKQDLALPSQLGEVFGKNISPGRTFGDLLNVERVSAERSLKLFKKPSESIIVERLDEDSMGKLFMFFILKMLFTGALLNINPFGQPAVESIKSEVARLIDENLLFEGENCIEI